MPEGPEIKYLGELCKKKLLKSKLINIISNSDNKVKLIKPSKLKDVITKGKLLILIFEDFYFHIHFGLTGWLEFESSKYPKYELVFEINNVEKTVYVDDMRRFSKLKIIVNKDKHEKILDKLGIDILTNDYTLEYFQDVIRSNNKLLTAVLLNQDKICGIGNYIKNESLYIARIDPHRKTSTLSDEEILKLYNAIRFVAYSNLIEQLQNDKLKIDKILKTIKTEVPYRYRVYDREKDLLGHKITTETISGRRTFYVKEIQK
jgi:formamidopyrimidine-DNA glycosylase